ARQPVRVSVPRTDRPCGEASLARSQHPRVIAPSHRTRALIGAVGCILMSALNFTLVSPAMPRALDELGRSSLYSWSFTANLAADAIATIIAGKLLDVLGRKPVMLGGLALLL